MLLEGVDEFYRALPTKQEITWQDFRVWFFNVRHPRLKADKLRLLSICVDKLIENPKPEIETESELLGFFLTRDASREVMAVADELGEGTATLNDLRNVVENYERKILSIQTGTDPFLVDASYANAAAQIVRLEGVNWRLADLNTGIGPLLPGDFIVVAGRPEAGKTTFVCDQMTFMLPQLPADQPGMMFNNEEMGTKIRGRIAMSALNFDRNEIEDNKDYLDTMVKEALGGRDVLIVENESMTTGFCERYLHAYNPSVVVFNIMDKIVTPGGRDTQDVDRLRQLFQWGRCVAAQGRIVFALAQAGDAAEGMKWIKQNMIYGSRTAVQGEADLLITIGMTHDPGEAKYRYLHTPKNKLPGGRKTDPTQRHGMHEVGFDAERGRFYSKLSTGERV